MQEVSVYGCVAIRHPEVVTKLGSSFENTFVPEDDGVCVLVARKE